ncbi:Acetyltransferase (GNAT) family protein [Desulfocicer vacuolatum DSM 3385]|uniref:Acetyltransferase (GNAT) family protein n=1 Tax=Desulfocicer vacuolatum DSM 3385 TaxID=1121400 RepID=A0A1W2EQR2_9BACT|nr:GNAT family N-acetyltransferase [Desulfocicer vacuolatum]SMD12057.1 Acetyltransferase (GNAT) family protein [Desulfocicer vacuolatum DSM 3385]
MIKTQHPQFNLKFAQPRDAGLVVEYMQKLGIYQKMRDKIIAEKEEMEKILSEKRGEAVFGEYDGKTVAFAYFYNNSSAFIGQRGMFIDGFYVDEKMRYKGLGKIMMAFLSHLAIQKGCKRLEWGCLDWNEPSIKFYKNLGAYCVDNMRIYRFAPDILKKVAAEFQG